MKKTQTNKQAATSPMLLACLVIIKILFQLMSCDYKATNCHSCARRVTTKDVIIILNDNSTDLLLHWLPCCHRGPFQIIRKKTTTKGKLLKQQVNLAQSLMKREDKTLMISVNFRTFVHLWVSISRFLSKSGTQKCSWNKGHVNMTQSNLKESPSALWLQDKLLL